MSNQPIKSGNEIDWAMAEKAARAILKQCDDIGFCPPEAVDIHQMRIGYVCRAMDSIADALRLRKRDEEEIKRDYERLAAECDQLRARLDKVTAELGQLRVDRAREYSEAHRVNAQILNAKSQACDIAIRLARRDWDVSWACEHIAELRKVGK